MTPIQSQHSSKYHDQNATSSPSTITATNQNKAINHKKPVVMNNKPINNVSGSKSHGSFWTNAIQTAIPSETTNTTKEKLKITKSTSVARKPIQHVSKSSAESSLEKKYSANSKNAITRSALKHDNLSFAKKASLVEDYAYQRNNKNTSLVPTTPQQNKKKREVTQAEKEQTNHQISGRRISSSRQDHNVTTIPVNRPIISPKVKRSLEQATNASQTPHKLVQNGIQAGQMSLPTKTMTPNKKIMSPMTMVGAATTAATTTTRSTVERVAVFFNERNTGECTTMVQSLATSGSEVLVVLLGTFNHEITQMLRMKRVTFKVIHQDNNTTQELSKVLKGIHRAILVTKFWERFEDLQEEKEALTLIRACHEASVSQVLFSTAEDTQHLREEGLTSQIAMMKPGGCTTSAGNDGIDECNVVGGGGDGTLHPTFAGMKRVRKEAKAYNILLTHMITSYLDYEKSGASLCVISGPTGKLIVTPCSIDQDEVAKALEHRMFTTNDGKGQILDVPSNVIHDTPKNFKSTISPDSKPSSQGIPSPFTNYDENGHHKSPMSNQSATPAPIRNDGHRLSGEVTSPLKSPAVVPVRQLATDFDSACSPTKGDHCCHSNDSSESTRAAISQNKMGASAGGKPMPFVSYKKASSSSNNAGCKELKTEGVDFLGREKEEKNVVATDSCTDMVTSILSFIGLCVTWFLWQVFVRLPMKTVSFTLQLILASCVISIGWLYFVESQQPQDGVCMGYYGCNPQGIY